MIYIYVSELEKEAPMDKKNWKRGKEESTRIPTLIYKESCQESRREKSLEKEIEKEILQS
jgi:hypothetical protein